MPFKGTCVLTDQTLSVGFVFWLLPLPPVAQSRGLHTKLRRLLVTWTRPVLECVGLVHAAQALYLGRSLERVALAGLVAVGTLPYHLRCTHSVHCLLEAACGDEVVAYSGDPVRCGFLLLWHTVIAKDISLLSATGLLSSWLELYPHR